MTTLTPTEVATAQQLLQSYAPAQTTLSILTTNNGDLADCLAQLSNPTAQKSLWHSTLTVLRQELCSDEGWRGKVKEYTKNPASAPLLTGLIVHLISDSTSNSTPASPPASSSTSAKSDSTSSANTSNLPLARHRSRRIALSKHQNYFNGRSLLSCK